LDPEININQFRTISGSFQEPARFFNATGRCGATVKESDMSIEGKAKEAAGFVKEEAYEHGKSPESKEKAQEGRDLRNEGRIEDGKPPKTGEPGSGDAKP